MAGNPDIYVYGPTVLTSNNDGDRNIYVGTATPSNSLGQDGDIFIQYS